MKRICLLLIAAMALWLLPTAPLLAAGTPAGTNITNTAKVSYVVDTATIEQDSNAVSLQVAELIDATLTWQDSGDILVDSGETGTVATFLLTNTGNGDESFALAVDNALGSDQFDPLLAGIYLDGNGNNTYEAGIDPLYSAGSNDPQLPADGSISLFVLNDVPGSLSDSDTGGSRLAAESETGTGSPGTVFSGQGDGGVNAILGSSGGTAANDATLRISAVDVTVIKSATVADPFGGSEPMPTATITYTIDVTASGSGTAQSVTVNDPVPANTTYVDTSLKLDGGDLSDAADGDAGEVAGGAVTVRLGDLQNTTKTVTFQVTID